MERQLRTQMSFDNRDTTIDLWAFFLVLLLLTLNIIYCECYLMTYLCGIPKRGYIYGSSCKTVSNSASD